MRRALLYFLLCIALFAPLAGTALPPERTTTVADRRFINLTVYNAGTALVHDRRQIRLENGLNRIAWRDVSASMDPTSALLASMNAANRIDVLEQNFDYDLLDPSALLQRYVGKYVTVVHEARFAGERDTRERARVLSVNGGVVLQYRDRIETQLRGYIIYPVAPRDFRDRPTLVLDVASAQSGEQLVDLSYLTSGMSWYATYVGVLSPDERSLGLTGLVTLSNNSGASYENARLQLVAGNVNIVQNGTSVVRALKTIAAVSDMYQNQPQQENYFEYHLYTMPHPTTVLDKQTKQLTLLAARDIPVHKTLELRGSPDYYRSAEPDLGDKLPIGVYVSFENRGGDLGIPLPAGIVRIYKNDSHGLSQFLGSDQVDHTPRFETVRLHLGNSFDVTARKKQTDFRFTGTCTTDSSYAITLGNAKSTPQDVLVVEPIPAQWSITSENMPHKKSSASTANWNVHLPPEQHATLQYTAHVTWCG